MWRKRYLRGENLLAVLLMPALERGRINGTGEADKAQIADGDAFFQAQGLLFGQGLGNLFVAEDYSRPLNPRPTQD